MFNDHQDNQAQQKTDIDQVAQDITADKPAFGLGANPSTFSPVMPPQASSAPPTTDTPADTSEPVATDEPAGSALSAPHIVSPTTSPSSTPLPADLDEIKNQALQQLSPLVDKIDQPPEERFKTLMMMIQASDNHDLIKDAYEAANAITDENIKAEALLAIVNEINYFTQQKSHN